MSSRFVRTITKVKNVNKLSDHTANDNDIITDLENNVYLKNGVNNYIKLGSSENSENSEILQSIKSDITSLKSQNTKLKNRVTDLETSNTDSENTNNLLNIDTLEKGKTVDTDGSIISDDIRWLTDFIPLDSQLEEQINLTEASYRVALYDKDKEFISRTGTNGSHYKPSSSSFTKYVRISGSKDPQEVMMNKGNELLPYEEPIKKKVT